MSQSKSKRLRREARQTPVVRCSRASCSNPAAYALVGDDGDVVRSCTECWEPLLIAIGSLGGHVGLAGQPASGGRSRGRVDATSRGEARVSGRRDRAAGFAGPV